MAEIINLDKLNYKLEILANLDISKALNKACLVVENEAKRLCPVDTGDLRNSITHEVDDDVGIVGTNKEYAPYVEYGTGIFAVEGNGRDTPWSYQDDKGEWHTTIGQKPQPFLNPAARTKKKLVIKVFNDEITRQIQNGG